MVSPVDSEVAEIVTRTALKWLNITNDPDSVRSSVMALPDDIGYTVSIIQKLPSEPLKVHLLHVDSDGRTVRGGARK